MDRKGIRRPLSTLSKCNLLKSVIIVISKNGKKETWHSNRDIIIFPSVIQICEIKWPSDSQRPSVDFTVHNNAYQSTVNSVPGRKS